MKEISQLIEAKNYQEAERKLVELLANDKNNISAKEWYGILEMEQKNYIRSKQYFEEVLIAKPQNPTLLYNLGLVYDNLGENEKAIDFYSKCLTNDENHKKAKSKLEKISSKKDLYGFLKYEWSPTKSSANIYYLWSLIYAIMPCIAIFSLIHSTNLFHQHNIAMKEWEYKHTSQLSPLQNKDSFSMSDISSIRESMMSNFNQIPEEPSVLWIFLPFFSSFLSLIALPKSLTNLIYGLFNKRNKYKVFENGIEMRLNGLNKKIIKKYMYQISSIEGHSPLPLGFTNDWVLQIPIEDEVTIHKSFAAMLTPWGAGKYCLFVNGDEKMEEIKTYIDTRAKIDREEKKKSMQK